MAETPERNLLPAIRTILEQMQELEQDHKAEVADYERKKREYTDSLTVLRKLNTVCEKCGGTGKTLRVRACAEDFAVDPDDPEDWLTCNRCNGTGQEPKEKEEPRKRRAGKPRRQDT